MVKQEPAFSFRMTKELRDLAEILTENGRLQSGTYQIKVGGSMNDTINQLATIGAYRLRDHLKETGGWEAREFKGGSNEVAIMTELMGWFIKHPNREDIDAETATNGGVSDDVLSFLDDQAGDDASKSWAPTRTWVAERYARAVAHQSFVRRVVDHIDRMRGATTQQDQVEADAEAARTWNKKPLAVVRNDEEDSNQ